jgi:hypothetical protein
VPRAALVLRTCQPSLPCGSPVPRCPLPAARDLCEVPFRDDIKPLNVVQPEGASWTVGCGWGQGVGGMTF